jgi:hypothetical protein
VYLLFEINWNFRSVIACKREAFAHGSALFAVAGQGPILLCMGLFSRFFVSRLHRPRCEMDCLAGARNDG